MRKYGFDEEISLPIYVQNEQGSTNYVDPRNLGYDYIGKLVEQRISRLRNEGNQ